VLAALGITHFLLVDRRPGSEEGPMLRDLALGARAGRVFDPSAGTFRTTREALLPTEMDFPLTALWTVERPGPFLVLYSLAGE
jgi:hypothetical protein